ncbi:MAG TPA: hypothetical protein VGI75_13670 [Pirellulales bacterium]|jgi:hypothetical protein
MNNRFQQSGAEVANENQEAAVIEQSTPSAELQSTIEAFERFETWIDDQLAALESRWIHVAAPAATRPRRISGAKGHPANPAE